MDLNGELASRAVGARGRTVVLALLAFAATTTAHAAPAFSDPVDVAPGDTLASGVPSATYNGADVLEIGWATLNVDEETLLSTARRPLGGPFAPGPPIGGLGDAQGPVLATAPGGPDRRGVGERRFKNRRVAAR